MTNNKIYDIVYQSRGERIRMTSVKENEFNNIVGDILNNNEFKKLDNELHHGITRYGHSLRVAKTTFRIAKLFKMSNFVETTRAALLHDFYTNDEFGLNNKKRKMHDHPLLAVNNAKKFYELSPVAENIIKSHMFPLRGELPKYKESWVVSSADKAVASYELYRFKFSMVLSIWVLFLFNIITIQK